MKRISLVLLALVLAVGMAVSAYASEVPNMNTTCSLTLTMEWDGKPLDSGSLTIYRVGGAVWEDEQWTYVLDPLLQSSGLSLENLSDPELAQSLSTLVADSGITGITAPIEDGKAVFSNLQTGLYLVVQKADQASTGLSPIRPFLITLPQRQNGQYVYNVTAAPKVSLEPKPTTPSIPTTPTDPTLPQTGLLNWPVPAMSAAGIALFALGWYLCFGGKKDRHET